MADENLETPERGYNTKDVRTQPEPERKGGSRVKPFLASLLLVPALLFGLWTWITLTYTYSRGERAGVIQKFSQKGWLCKTWEGELAMVTMPGTVQETFQFTVRKDEVARRLDELYKQGGRVSLTYEQHRGVPMSCFGETQYFVTGAQPIGVSPGQGMAPSLPGYPQQQQMQQQQMPQQQMQPQSPAPPGTAQPMPAPAPRP